VIVGAGGPLVQSEHMFPVFTVKKKSLHGPTMLLTVGESVPQLLFKVKLADPTMPDIGSPRQRPRVRNPRLPPFRKERERMGRPHSTCDLEVALVMGGPPDVFLELQREVSAGWLLHDKCELRRVNQVGRAGSEGAHHRQIISARRCPTAGAAASHAAAAAG